jgi:hypothetical protein
MLMHSDAHGLDPLTVAHDCLHAAGFICRGIDMQSFDPLRAAVAEYFVKAARGCHGDPQRLAVVIRSQLTDAIRSCREQIAAEASDIAG